MPFFGDIPVLSDLVNGRDSSSVDKQLLFLLKVHIIHPFKAETVNLESTSDEIHKASEILEQSRKLFTNKPASEFVDVEALLHKESINRQTAEELKKAAEASESKPE